MDVDNGVAILPIGLTSRCLHSRMLENIRDPQGNKADTLRCCECGTFVVVHTQHSEVS
jgi:hypothetical protein